MPIGTTNIKLSDIQTEYGGSNPISLSEYYRGGSFVIAHPNNTGIPSSGAISCSHFFNQRKEWVVTVTISANTTNFNLRSFLNSTYGDFSSVPTIVTVTINSGVVVSSTSTGTPAFTTGSSWAAGSTFALVNNGSIIGMGGAGGTGTGATAGTAGSSGGPALSITLPTTITNGSGTLAGGGGGGGGGASVLYSGIYIIGGGGGGGGQSYTNSSGGAHGSWSIAMTTYPTNGSAGTNAGGGAGGGAGVYEDVGKGGGTWVSGAGGAGGSYGAAGASGAAVGSGTTYYNATAGGAAGNYINLNGQSVTWVSFGTRLGGSGA